MIITEEKAIDDVTQDFYIPIKPKILTQFQSLMSDNESIIADFVHIISKDVALSSAVLELINSAAFGLNKKICDIEHAVCFMGKDAINDISTAILFRRSFANVSSCLSLERYWDDAKDIAYTMAFINKKYHSQFSDGFMYTIGLFHDCGIPAFSNKFDDYKETLIECNEEGCNSIASEESKYRTNHAVVGYFIATSWNLPEEVCNIILHHHDFNFLAKTSNINEHIGFATLKLAENLVHVNKRHCESPDWQHVRDDVLNLLNLNADEYFYLEKHYSDIIL